MCHWNGPVGGNLYRHMTNIKDTSREIMPCLYTTIHHSKLKDRLREMVQLCF